MLQRGLAWSLAPSKDALRVTITAAVTTTFKYSFASGFILP